MTLKTHVKNAWKGDLDHNPSGRIAKTSLPFKNNVTTSLLYWTNKTLYSPNSYEESASESFNTRNTSLKTPFYYESHCEYENLNEGTHFLMQWASSTMSACKISCKQRTSHQYPSSIYFLFSRRVSGVARLPQLTLRV